MLFPKWAPRSPPHHAEGVRTNGLFHLVLEAHAVESASRRRNVTEEIWKGWQGLRCTWPIHRTTPRCMLKSNTHMLQIVNIVASAVVVHIKRSVRKTESKTSPTNSASFLLISDISHHNHKPQPPVIVGALRSTLSTNTTVFLA